jgi:cyclopropane-fatty-acyl-phospholipid synthase
VNSSERVRADRGPDSWNALLGMVLRGGIHAGELTVRMPGGREHRFAGARPGPEAEVVVHDRSAARRVIAGGSIGLAEAYMEGAWDSPDLGAVLDLGLTNMELGGLGGMPVVMRPVQRAWHKMRDNDPQGGSKRNIAYHYDLGNDFYKLWLDDSMTYSCACSPDESEPFSGSDLASAQRRKWDRVLELIQPRSKDHILEIGCGWGGFAVHAAREAGCRVTGVTLSEQQLALARERVAEEGLEGRVDIRLQDYRDVPGTFDGIASIEMFEAVGERWWPVFFRRLRELLRPGCAAGMQVITIAEQGFENYRRNPDFIQRYVFPGGMLPSLERFRNAAQKAHLTVDDPRFFGLDYARTLSVWAERFEAALPDIRSLGFDDRFVRMWRYYLAYCRTGFEHGSIDVMQVRLEG